MSGHRETRNDIDHLPEVGPHSLWLFLNVWLSLLVVCGSAAVTLHLPMAHAAWPILIFCFGLMLVLESDYRIPEKCLIRVGDGS